MIRKILEAMYLFVEKHVETLIAGFLGMVGVFVGILYVASKYPGQPIGYILKVVFLCSIPSCIYLGLGYIEDRKERKNCG